MNDGFNPILSCEKLTKLFPVGDGLFALSDVNLHINKGQFVVIMGPSGSGKSTLLNIFGGIDRPSHGDVILNGQRYSQLSEDELAILRRTELSMVFQFFNLFPDLTVFENVSIPLWLAGKDEAEIVPRAKYLLKEVNLLGRSSSYPSELSGGEQQRVAIARALAPKPAVVLADEPTGNLDSKMSKDVMELFAKFNKEENQTFIVVTHESKFQQYADTIIYLADGEVRDISIGGACRKA